MSHNLPNLVIAGVPKSGTSSIFRWLSDHPETLAANRKETCYFADRTEHTFDPAANWLDHGIEGYRQFFPVSSGEKPKLIFEATPDYIYQETALGHLPDIESGPQFIFMLREPAAQLYSVFQYYKHNWAQLPPQTTFSEFAEGAGDLLTSPNRQVSEGLQFARYVDHLRRWCDRVGPERIQIYLFEEMTTDPAVFMRRLAIRNGIEPDFYNRYDFPAENETYTVRWAPLQKINTAVRARIPDGALYRLLRSGYRRLNTSKGKDALTAQDQETMARLREEFAPCNVALAAEFDLDLSLWNR